MSKHDRITSEAAKWAIRIDAGMTGAEQDEFLEWLMADSAHGAELERQRLHWDRLDILADWRPVHASRPNRDLLAVSHPAWRAFFSKRRLLLGGILALPAAAACIFALVFLEPAPGHLPPVAAIPGVATTHEPISTIEQQKLDDGTIVELNRGASIKVLYTATERHVRLEHGEANFNVAKDPNRPFIVNINGVNVRAVGTSFNVRHEGAAIEVLVTSGKVQVQAPRETVPDDSTKSVANALVNAGQYAVVTLESMNPGLVVRAVETHRMDEMIAWHPRLLDFSERPLADIVEEVNKCNAPIQLVLAEPELAGTIVSATLRSDQVENLVSLLRNGFGIRSECKGNTITLYKENRR
ncbi:transmembrane sensor [Ereboglobus sp. PH5-5]|uniref:FecR family protein n=1 Tax=Ereboglobus sp. PH5-5 TaxID=2940529 RepID=UPI0024065F20|nr:FecR domain-containing protein [Ereboglobus sp. PH5-5]MDF9833485.1 transmembrane sensor [Ereboglobus sp. PH5-5]